MMTTPSVLDLDDIIRRHAWRILKERSNALRRWLLEEKDYLCEVDWNAVVFHHHVSKFEVHPDGNTYNRDWGSIKTGVRWIPLHTCDFENRSESKQCHTFRGSRETTAWIAVELSQTYTVSNAVDIDVTFPPDFRHGRVGCYPSFNINQLRGSVFKEVLEWQVNSQVEVVPSWKAHAQLLARQENHVIDVEVRTMLAVPNGVVPVYFKKRSNNSFAFEVKVEKVEEAFQSVEAGGVLRKDEEALIHTLMETVIDKHGCYTSHSQLQLITRGTCMCVRWSDQKVDIATNPLSVPTGHDGDVHVS